MFSKSRLWLLAIALLALVGPASAQTAERRNPGDKRFGEEEQIEQRRKWFALQRGLDSVDRPDAIRAAAIEETRQALASLGENQRVPGAWSVVGPSPMTMLSWTMGKVAGRVSAFAVTPGNENLLYLGTASGGLWKTTNGGTSWTSIFDNVGTQSIGSLALDPSNSNTLWVGTGEQGQYCSDYFGLGLFRSTDGGVTFVDRNGSGGSALNLSYVTAVAVQPGNSNVVLAGGAGYCSGGGLYGGGLYRSTDGGNSWTQIVSSGPVHDIVFDPNNSSIVYAAATYGVYKSTNGGASFSQLTGVPSGYRTRLAMAPSNSQVLYALQENKYLYRTTDGGNSWSLRNSNACDGQCWYNLALDVHPTSSDTVLVGAIRVWRSTNGGTTLSVLDNTWGSSQKVHQDTHVVRYSRTNGSRFWVGSDGGLWRTDNGSTSYTNLNNGINITQFYDIAIHPTNSKIFGGAQDNSSSARTSSNTWSVVTVTGDGFSNIVDSGNANYVFITSYPQNGYPSVYRSTNGGAVNGFSLLPTTGITSTGFPWDTELTMIQGSGASYLFTGSNQVYRANARAGTWSWTSISTSLAGGSTLSAFGNQNAGNTLYAGFQNGRIFRTDNALAASPTWTEVTSGIPSGWISDIAVDPTNSQRVFVTRSVFGSSKLYRSTTGGASWTAVGSGLPDVPANTVVVDSWPTSRIFVGTDIGVYVSEDNGDTFVPQMSGMPLGTVVTDLELDDSPHVLTAGTYGRSAFQLSLPVPLGVSLSCYWNDGWGGEQTCYATAAGGVGPYSYSWAHYGSGYLSPSNETAYLWFYSCPTSASISVTVTDATSAQQTAWAYPECTYICPPPQICQIPLKIF